MDEAFVLQQSGKKLVTSYMCSRSEHVSLHQLQLLWSQLVILIQSQWVAWQVWNQAVLGGHTPFPLATDHGSLLTIHLCIHLWLITAASAISLSYRYFLNEL